MLIQKQLLPISLIFILQFLLTSNTFSQVFDWYYDGYVYYTDFYPNIDNSGIDIEISGITGGASTDNTVSTGLNGDGENGVQHTYTFRFSETVDVEFKITRINRDTTGLYCYNDQIILINNPTILNSSEVNIIGDTVFALWGGTIWSGSVHLRYENIDSLTFYHGEGTGCDPGSIDITPLIINDNFLNTNIQTETEIKIWILNDSKLIVENLTKLPEKLEIYNAMGQMIPYNSEINKNLIINIHNAVTGFYFVTMELANGSLIRERLYLK